MREHYVRPPLVAREAPARWVAVWRFRLVAVVLLALLVLVVVVLFLHFAGTTSEDPGLNALGSLAAVARPS